MRILGLLLAFGLSATAHALDDAETVRILTALGEWHAAYPLAIAEARRLDTVGAWEGIFSQSEYHDLTRPLNRREVYAEAWAAAKRADSPSAYREFIALAPESDGAALAIDRLFEQVKQEDTLEAYTEFMVEFPATSQSLEAMLRVEELVWQRVRQEDTLAAYDGYLDAFPNARFAPEAEAAAQRLVAQPYRERLAQCRADAETLRQEQLPRGEITARREKERMIRDCSERLAREIFNRARRTDAPRLGLRLFTVLDNEPAFAVTRVMTESLDRQERQQHQSQLRAVLEEQLAEQRAHTRALREGLEAQTERLEAAIEQQRSQLQAVLERQLAEQKAQTQALREGREAQTERLEAAIEQHQAVVQQQLVQVRGQMAQSGELDFTEKLRLVDEIRRWIEFGWDRLCRSRIVLFVPSIGPVIRSVCTAGGGIRAIF